jgi:hypothetical protein
VTATLPSLDEIRRELPALFAAEGVRNVHPHGHHLVCPLPTAEAVHAFVVAGQVPLLKSRLGQRERLMDRMDDDPLHYGWRPECWNDVARALAEFGEVLVLGGNRSMKTELGAWQVASSLVEKPESIWACLHMSEQSSIAIQQPRVHKYLPPEWRNIGREGDHTYVKFTRALGFPHKKFILPNGSLCHFFNYKQFRQDPGVFEGYEFDGVLADELIPQDCEETLRYRLVSRRGVLLETFTPMEGYTPTVSGWLAGARIVRTLPSELLRGQNVKDCPPGHMPYEIACVRPTSRVFFFHTQFNLYNPWDQMVKTIENEPPARVKIRAYGWPEKLVGTAFPKFKESVHVIRRAPQTSWSGLGMVPPSPWRAPGAVYPGIPMTGTNYVVADPGGTKNWFIKWYRCVSEPPWIVLYREWPPMSSYGSWAEMRPNIGNQGGLRFDGYPGPAQRCNFDPSILNYKRIVLESEGWTWDEQAGWTRGPATEEIWERWIDPRMGGAEVPSAEEGTSIISLMEDEQRDAKGRLIGPSMVWLSAPGGGRAIHNLQSLEIFNGWFHYDESAPVNVLNSPRFYVVDGCQQSIFAYKEYTGLDGEKGAMKDVVDPDWYLCKVDPQHVGEHAMDVRGAGGEDEE